MDDRQCPCGQPMTMAECCAGFIAGHQVPETAEALMRSRYTAFATHQIDYLLASHHPETRGQVSRDDVQRFSEAMVWHGLELLETVDGQAADTEGWVEFIARYRERGDERIHHERSLFRRHQGRWFFHSAEYPKPMPSHREQAKVGRNEPCPCGSGKKYKKCCAGTD